ncbi:hypothetical protein, partial [Azospirillum sp. TSA6c]|uniref:hypothetical protein n=1 Tax=Azospirillum sp. TSA6c TaxID=709813 RepID=UPI0018EE566B
MSDTQSWGEGVFRELWSHCSELNTFLSSQYLEFQKLDKKQERYITNCWSWLNLASGLNDVNFDYAKFDSGGGGCGLADRWTEMQQALHREFALSLSKFAFLWSGIESLIDAFSPEFSEKPKKVGKVNAACAHITSRLPKNFLLAGYSDIVSVLRSNARLPLEGTLPDFVSEPCEGLFIIYKTRNAFAHGGLQIPCHDYNEGERCPELDIINASCRMILLTMQNLIISCRGDDFSEIYWRDHQISAISTRDYVSQLHFLDRQYAVEEDSDSC